MKNVKEVKIEIKGKEWESALDKAFEKKKRKFLQEVKMAKEPPTKKQLYYYEKLCKKYNLEKNEIRSKLDARNEIDKIINEHACHYYKNETVKDD